MIDYRKIKSFEDENGEKLVLFGGVRYDEIHERASRRDVQEIHKVQVPWEVRK